MMTKMTKENYEFLLFELLEGNLNETEKNTLLEQINNDAFYQREWTLMQHAVALPDRMLTIENKESLLKPEGGIIAFAALRPMFKIAASLLLIGVAGWWFYSGKNETQIVSTPIIKTISPEAKNEESNKGIENNLKQNTYGNRNRIVSGQNSTYTPIVNPVTIKIIEYDSILPINLPEILLIKPMQNEGIAYKISPNEVVVPGDLILEKPVAKEPTKIVILIAQAEKIRTLTQKYWNDLPNLKLKVTPKFKERNIGFELKGETIYASALLEIKK